MIKRTATVAVFGLMALGAAALADEGKDESGKGKQRQEERSSYFHQHGHARIPNGHLPPPGECRIWYPDRPAGHQPPPFKCGEACGSGRTRWVADHPWISTSGSRSVGL